MSKETRTAILIVTGAILLLLAALFWGQGKLNTQASSEAQDGQRVQEVIGNPAPPPKIEEATNPNNLTDKSSKQSQNFSLDSTRILISPKANINGVDVNKALTGKVIQGNRVVDPDGSQ